MTTDRAPFSLFSTSLSKAAHLPTPTPTHQRHTKPNREEENLCKFSLEGEMDNGYPQQRRQPMEPEDDYDDDYPDDEPNRHAMERDENGQMNDATGAEDAVLDLAELEQLQEEAERMKGLGNKHMAAQVST
jgi:hypothetical protein